MKNVKTLINNIEENFSNNMQLKKEIWDKDIVILIPSGKDIKQISKEQLFILKLIFHMDYINSRYLGIILSPICSQNKIDEMINELVEFDLLKWKKKGYYGVYYYLSSRCMKKMTDNKLSTEYTINSISNTTLEVQDSRQLFLSYMVIEAVQHRLINLFNNMDSDSKEGYILSLFIKNISFNLMLKMEDRDLYLKELGYCEKEINRINSVKSYNMVEREKFKNKMLLAEGQALGYNDYYTRYKNYIREQKDLSFKYYFLYDLIALDSTFDYFKCINDTVRGEIKSKNVKAVKHNIVKNQTAELRQGLAYLSQLVMKENGLNPEVSNTLIIDKTIAEYQEKMLVLNVICTNLTRNLKGFNKDKDIDLDTLEFYNEISKCLGNYKDALKALQDKYNDYKKVAEFNDSKAEINPEDRPIICIKAFELRNVFIKNIEQINSKDGKTILKVSIANIDKTKNIKNFNNSMLRRDYFGICEFIKNIEADSDIKVYIDYTYYYLEGSNISNYEERLKRIFSNTSSNANMIGADKLVVKELKNFPTYIECMEKLNRIFIK